MLVSHAPVEAEHIRRYLRETTMNHSMYDRVEPRQGKAREHLLASNIAPVHTTCGSTVHTATGTGASAA